MAVPKTSTFIIDHERCNPGDWTARDVLAFRDFVATGSMQHAARLARLGLQLVTSEHHEPKGGSVEEIGWATLDEPLQTYDDMGEAIDNAGDDDITIMTRVYRGHAEYIVRFGIGGEDGLLEGHEYEVKPTMAEAEKFLASLREPEDATV
jgi:hypothetical protein